MDVVTRLSAGVTNETLRVVSRRHKGRFGYFVSHAIGLRIDIAVEEGRCIGVEA